MTTLDMELLLAYADGELDAETAARVRASIEADPLLVARLSQQLQLRNRVGSAYRDIIDEAVPDRLLQALQPSVATAATELSAAREARSQRAPPGVQRPASSWARWGGMAASLVLGLSIGLMLQIGKSTAPFESTAPGLLATGAIAEALSSQLASEPATGSSIRLQVSFLDHAGRYCRTFTTAALAGLACRDGAAWTLQTLLAVEAGAGSEMRQAGTPLPAALLKLVDARMRGHALDATSERAARQRNWQRHGDAEAAPARP